MSNDYMFEHGNENYRFIVASSAWNVQGVMQNDLAISGGNDFRSAKELISNLPIIGKALDIKDSYADIFKLSGRSNITDFESRLVWESSFKPIFSIDYKFYNMSAGTGMSPSGAMQKAKTLHGAVLPTKGRPAIARKGSFFKAPLGYKFGSNDASGVLSLQVGNWFRATNLVMKDHNFTPSKQVMSAGGPLFVSGSMTLEPYQAITYEEFLEFFR